MSYATRTKIKDAIYNYFESTDDISLLKSLIQEIDIDYENIRLCSYDTEQLKGYVYFIQDKLFKETGIKFNIEILKLSSIWD